jgi:hypothetical protein
MPLWPPLVFAMGWIVGLLVTNLWRRLRDNDLLGIFADCASAWSRSRHAHDLISPDPQDAPQSPPAATGAEAYIAEPLRRL